MRIVPILAALSLLLVLASPAPGAESFHNALSLQGFTGLLNTPNAETTDEGHVYLLYSDQKESKWRQRENHQDNWMGSIGLFDWVEIGGRFTEAPNVARDLSGNFKVRVPFPGGKYIPHFAVGIQDVTGGKGADFLHTKYAVASEQIWRFRFSAGYGTGPQRMHGFFGGVEVKACDWFYLLAEKDTMEKNVGARLVTPRIFRLPVQLQATVKTSLDHRPVHPELAVGLQIRLGTDHHSVKPLAVPPVFAAPPAPSEPSVGSAPPASPALKRSSSTQEVPPRTQPQSEPESFRPRKEPTREVELSSPTAAASGQAPDQRGELRSLLAKLTRDGFQNVRVGTTGSTLVVEYENARYNHNELDGIGVAAGIVVLNAPSRYETLRLVEKKKGIRMLQLEAPIRDWAGFFADSAQLEKLQSDLRVSFDVAGDEDVLFVQGDENRSYLKATLVLYPSLTTYLGTDAAPFDYLLSLKPDLYVNTWKGAVLNARWDLPISWSSNFDDNKTFRNDRHGKQLERLMLFQALKPTSTVMAVIGAGMVLHEQYGTLNEVVWTPWEGRHRVRLVQAYTENWWGGDRKEVYLAGYRYFLAPLNLFFEGTVGKMWTQDRGALAEFRRFFGDTAITVYYKNGVAVDHRNHQAVGLQLEFPLTPRRDMKPYPLQVRGTEDWSHAQETSIAKKNSLNYLGTAQGVSPSPPFNIVRTFYNRDRLSEPYLREHLLRLRDAYARYVLPGKY